MKIHNPIILIIDSAADICSVAIANNAGVIDSIELFEKNIHSEKLTIIIQELLKNNNIEYKTLAAIGINKGPGSYTGLRIGTSVAKGMCFALDIPLLSCDGLSAYAESILKYHNFNYDFIMTALDARRDEVYATILNKNGDIILPSQPLILDDNYNELLRTKCAGSIGIFSNCIDKFNKLTKVKKVYFNGNEYFKSLYLQNKLFDKYNNNLFENLNYFEPNYIKLGYHVTD